jgi:hypothetical protein
LHAISNAESVLEERQQGKAEDDEEVEENEDYEEQESDSDRERNAQLPLEELSASLACDSFA